MTKKDLPLLWVVAYNRKTGIIPSAYIGGSVPDTWESCEGCALREDGTCYAWSGLNAVKFQSDHVPRYHRQPEHFTLSAALARLAKLIKAKAATAAKAARIGVLGDPSRADRRELRKAISKLREIGFAVLGYTHFWRESEVQPLRGELMASCDNLKQADEALAKGWRPAVVLPWYHEGNRFDTPGGAPGVVCPAQTKDPVTCNSCRMCDPKHPVWAAGRVKAIGFIDHSATARAAQERTRHEPTTPMFEGVPAGGATELGTCSRCGAERKSIRLSTKLCGLCESRARTAHV